MTTVLLVFVALLQHWTLLVINMFPLSARHQLFLATLLLSTGISSSSIHYPTQMSSGSPWPLPASMTTTDDHQPVDSMLFHFNATGHTCDILEVAFIRYFRIIFHGQPYHKKYSAADSSKVDKRDGQQLVFKPQMKGGLKSLDVALLNECEKWPSLEMDESCE